MTLQQALAILEQATAQIQANRQTHLQIMEAMKLISQAIASLPKKELQ